MNYLCWQFTQFELVISNIRFLVYILLLLPSNKTEVNTSKTHVAWRSINYSQNIKLNDDHFPWTTEHISSNYMKPFELKLIGIKIENENHSRAL